MRVRQPGRSQASKRSGVMGRSQPLQLVVDPVAHAEELARFAAHVVRGPGAEDCAIWTGAVGTDGYGRN